MLCGTSSGWCAVSRDWLGLATQALHAAIREDWPAAQAAVRALAVMDDGAAWLDAALAWCDTALAAQGISKDDGVPSAVRWRLEGSTAVESADDVPEAVRWAGQIINARACDDRDTYYALMGAVPEGAELGRHVGTLLQCCAATIRASEAVR
jgi:hypothetical protein